MVPHVRSTPEAGAAATAAQHGAGSRSYAGSSRAGDFTAKPIGNHLADSAAQTMVLAQIEVPEAAAAVVESAAVDGIYALFVDRVSRTVACRAVSQDDPRVLDAPDAVRAAGRGEGRPTGMFRAREADAAVWAEKGAQLLRLGSDDGFLLGGAAALSERVRGA